MIDQFEQPRIGAEEMAADVAAWRDAVLLIIAINGLLPCAPASRAVLVGFEQRIPSEPQMTLMTFQPAPRKSASSSWMIFPLPRTGPSSRWRLQLTTQVRLSSRSRAASVSPATASRLIHLAIADECPHVGLGILLQKTACDKIAIKPHLVIDWIGPSPIDTVGTAKSLASNVDADTTIRRRPVRAEIFEMLSGEPAFEKALRNCPVSRAPGNRSCPPLFAIRPAEE